MEQFIKLHENKVVSWLVRKRGYKKKKQKRGKKKKKKKN